MSAVAVKGKWVDVTKPIYEVECSPKGKNDWVAIVNTWTFQGAINEINDLIRLDNMDPGNKYEYRVFNRVAGRHYAHATKARPRPKLSVIQGGKKE